MDADFTIRYESPNSKRGAFRACVPGLQVILPGGERRQIKDLSAGGVGFAATDTDAYPPDTLLLLDLLVADKLYVGALTARVVRVIPGGAVACSFINLNRSQEMRLDKLVLEMQKRLIALRKAREAAESASHVTQGASSESDAQAATEGTPKKTEPIVMDLP